MCFSVRCQPRGRNDDRGRLAVAQLVRLALRRGEAQRAVDRVAQVQLAGNDVLPERGVGVLVVGQPHLRARVQRIDRHLRVGRSGDLHAAIHQTWRGLGHPPLRLADVLSLVEKLQQPARRQLPLPLVPPREQLATPRVEGPVQVGQEVQRLRREDLVEPVVDGAGDLDAHEENLCFRGQRRNTSAASSSLTGSSMSYASVMGPRSNLSILSAETRTADPGDPADLGNDSLPDAVAKHLRNDALRSDIF